MAVPACLLGKSTCLTRGQCWALAREVQEGQQLLTAILSLLEIRLQEMVSMGVGSKPFLDIQPSEAAIHDRAIDYIMKGRGEGGWASPALCPPPPALCPPPPGADPLLSRFVPGARTRASIAVSLFDHASPFARSQAPLSAAGPSSCSVLGPLNLHLHLDRALLPNLLATSRSLEVEACIEEDETENETSSQPSMSTCHSPFSGPAPDPAPLAGRGEGVLGGGISLHELVVSPQRRKLDLGLAKIIGQPCGPPRSTTLAFGRSCKRRPVLQLARGRGGEGLPLWKGPWLESLRGQKEPPAASGPSPPLTQPAGELRGAFPAWGAATWEVLARKGLGCVSRILHVLPKAGRSLLPSFPPPRAPGRVKPSCLPGLGGKAPCCASPGS